MSRYITYVMFCYITCVMLCHVMVLLKTESLDNAILEL